MTMKNTFPYIVSIAVLLTGSACRKDNAKFDASGVFEAREDLQEAARESAQPATILLELAELLRTAGDAAAELETWCALVTRAPDDLGAAHARMAALSRAVLEAGNVTQARIGFAALATLPLSGEARCEAFLGLAQCCEALVDRAGAADPSEIDA